MCYNYSFFVIILFALLLPCYSVLLSHHHPELIKSSPAGLHLEASHRELSDPGKTLSPIQ